MSFRALPLSKNIGTRAERKERFKSVLSTPRRRNPLAVGLSFLTISRAANFSEVESCSKNASRASGSMPTCGPNFGSEGAPGFGIRISRGMRDASTIAFTLTP
jgi:hypothetical protein